ncbi:hypothetical protein [Nocardia sp. NPDC006630]|uniref:WXG100-like domain-containing protein n=1 Tax=Nocardia sp. NPDC006630 TaxID=3157181 RepID=UPI0033B5217F
MALEFPSWLEWLSWVVGSAWPHGNEDKMWQMARDIEAVAGQADDIITDLDHLINALGDAYPDGDGGQEMLKWLTPLRDGDASGHGSVREFADNYRQLSTAADGMGDQLQAGKLNFYIAGAWLIGELAWAAATGPFAPESEAVVLSTARVFFRELGQQAAERIEQMIEGRITNAVLKEVLPKLIYEIGQGALVSTFQGTAQEFLVQTIQNETGHGHGYDWGAIGKNALVSAVSGAGGGAAGFGAHHMFPTDMGGMRGVFNGALTGATAGLGGAGTAWLAGGLVNGNWDLDPRTLTGGALAGAGPSGLHGYDGRTNHAGPMDFRDGSAPIPRDAGVQNFGTDHSGVTTLDRPGASTLDQPGTTTGGRPGGVTDPAVDGQPGGPGVHSTSATGVDTTTAPGRDTSGPGHDGAPGDNNAPSVIDNRRDQPEANAQDGTGTTDSSSHPASDASAPGGDRADDTNPADNGGNSDSGTNSRSDIHSPIDDPASRVEAASHPGDTAPHSASESSADPYPQAANSVSPVGATGPVGEAGQPAPPASAPPAHATPSASPNPVAASEVRAPAADPGKAVPLPRDFRAGAPSDGTALKPSTPSSDPRAAAIDRPNRPDAAVRAASTGVEPAAPHARPDSGGDHQDGRDPLAAASADRAGAPGDDRGAPGDRVGPAGGHTGAPGDHSAVPGDHAGAAGDHAGAAGDHAGAAGDHAGAAGDHAGAAGEHAGAAGDHTGSAGERAGVPEAVIPIPVDTSAPHRAEADGPRIPGENRKYDVAAAGPVGEFHGSARTGDPLSLDFVHDQIKEQGRLITPEGVSWNRDEQHFVLSDGRLVRIEVGPTERNNVAEFRPSADGFEVRVSEHARDQDVVRALAHELAEIRLSQDDDILIDPHDDRPTRMSTQLGGRFAELRTLTTHIDRAIMDPGRAHELPGLRRDLSDLMDHLGFRDPAHAPTVEHLLAGHDSTLAHRIELERDGVHSQRPAFNPDLTQAGFDHAAENHLGGLRDLLTGDHADDVVRTEEQGLNGRLREELSRRVFDPIFEPEAKAARGQVPGLFRGLDPINAAINHPTLRGPEQAAAIHRAIDRFHDGMPEAAREALGPDRFAQMHAAAEGFATAADRITGVIDHETGRMTVGGEQTTLADFLHGIDRANRGAAENGLTVEYAVILHDPVDGLSTVEVLPRPQPQHRLPLDQLVFGPGNERIAPQPRPPVPAAAVGGHTIDVGVGRGAFGVEMTPAADRAGGGLIIKTELADAALAGQRRRDLGILDPGPLTEPGSVMVFGDLLGNGHLLGGDIARVYINNVSAKLPDAVYDAIARNLSEGLAPGGRVEVQWDMKPDKVDGPPGSRNHILGTKLWEALERVHQDGTNPFTLVERTDFPHPGNKDYDYTIDAGSSNKLPHERMAEFSPPQPEHRWVISYEPDSDGNAAHDRPAEMTPQLRDRFDEMRGLAAHIDEVTADRARQHEVPDLQGKLHDLIERVGLRDPAHAPTAERLLAEYDPDLARRIDLAHLPPESMLRPGEFDPESVPTPHDLGRIDQLQALAEQAARISPEAGPDSAEHNSLRREALSLVERLGLRQDTPGAAERRELIADLLPEHARGQVDDLLADAGRRESDLPAQDRQFVDEIRLATRASNALDFLSLPFHKAVMKAHLAYRAEMAEHLARSADEGPGATATERIRLAGNHIVEDPDSGARWFRWPPDAEETPASAPAPDIGLPADPDFRLPADPQQLHEVWSNLSPEQKDAWHRADPFIGNRDGIPQIDRDRYNRQTLELLRERAENTSPERLDIIRDMQKFLEPTEEGMPEHYLSYLDDKLQYIYALGNPDTAHNVAIELAGAFRRRSGVGYALETLEQVRQAALAIDPTAATSVILFGAYNNPNSLVSALHSAHAEDGAAKVREYHDGLRVTHQGPPAHMTTIAHSYGGVTGGHSAGHGHALNTDALVFVGSWGTGVAHAGDLRLTGVDPAETGDHVFATMAEYDSIQLMPPTHGPAPTDPAFGATVFESGTTPSHTRLGWNPADHVGKNYFGSRNQSYRSLGLILTGHEDLLR